MSRPLVSVCIPARDAARHLGAALEGALSQNVELEVLVGDDGSRDATAQVARATGDVRVRCFRHRTPIGVADNRSFLLGRARGRHVAWLDADDVWPADSLAARVRLLEEQPGIAIVHAGFDLIGGDDEPLPPWDAPFDRDAIEPSATAFGNLVASNELTTSTVVARRDLQLEAGGFRAWIGPSSTDWDMWLRLALRGEVAYLAQTAARYRRHADSISARTERDGRRLRCDVRLIGALLASEAGRLPSPALTRERACAALAAKAVLHAGELQARGEREPAARAAGLGARLFPDAGPQAWSDLAAAARTGDDAGSFGSGRELLGALAGHLEGTRFGARLRRAARTDPAWQSALERMARVVASVTPSDAVLGAVAKWDPTLLTLSGRQGRNYPDRALLPDGYPRDDAQAIAHLEDLRAGGVSHLVLPSASFWWLEYYRDLARHLEHRHRLAWRDEDCVIYDLRPAA